MLGLCEDCGRGWVCTCVRRMGYILYRGGGTEVVFLLVS